MKLLLLLSAVASLVFASSSDSTDNQLEILQLPREIRPSSSTEYKAPPPAIINPGTLEKDSPTTISEVLSVDFIAVPKDQIETRPLMFLRPPSQLFFNPQIKTARFTSPRDSPIIAQLNLIDQLMASHFPPIEKPKPLLAGHLAVLKSNCRDMLVKFGPLHPRYVNCAFSYHEISRFAQLVAKYDTSLISQTSQKLRRSSFCSDLIAQVKQLFSLANAAFHSSAHLISSSLPASLSAALAPHSKELKELDMRVDTVDLDLIVYCHLDPNNHTSINTAREIISEFLHLAFN